jgi:serine/threonine protein kinase
MGGTQKSHTRDWYAFSRLLSKEGELEFWLGYDKLEHIPVRLVRLCAEAPPAYEMRFRRAAQMMAKIRSDYIARFRDYYVDDNGHHVLVCEHLDGQTLDEWLRLKPLTVEQTLELGSDLLRALMDLHQEQMIHRNLHPAIVVMTRFRGRCKAMISDMSHVRKLWFEDLSTNDLTGITAIGIQVGHWGYTAPEQLFDVQDASVASDVYSVGAMMYHALNGKPLMADQVPNFSKVSPWLKPAEVLKLESPDPANRMVEAIVNRAIHHLAHKRFPSASSMSGYIHRALKLLRSGDIYSYEDQTDLVRPSLVFDIHGSPEPLGFSEEEAITRKIVTPISWEEDGELEEELSKTQEFRKLMETADPIVVDKTSSLPSWRPPDNYSDQLRCTTLSPPAEKNASRRQSRSWLYGLSLALMCCVVALFVRGSVVHQAQHGTPAFYIPSRLPSMSAVPEKQVQSPVVPVVSASVRPAMVLPETPPVSETTPTNALRLWVNVKGYRRPLTPEHKKACIEFADSLRNRKGQLIIESWGGDQKRMPQSVANRRARLVHMLLSQRGFGNKRVLVRAHPQASPEPTLGNVLMYEME